MIPVNNVTIQSPKAVVRPQDDGYRCIHCGAWNSGEARYTETVYGRADLESLDGELYDHETTDSDCLEIHEFVCRECGESRSRIDGLFVPPYEYEGDDDEELEELEEEND